jgi:hypothetical protein
MAQQSATILHEVRYPQAYRTLTLCFQYVCYHLEDGREEEGYRFIYRAPDGRMLSGILYIPTAEQLWALLQDAIRDGWLESPPLANA